jgi:hypothetical protein
VWYCSMGRKRAPEREQDEESNVEVGESGNVVMETVVGEVSADCSHWTRELLVPRPLDSVQKHIKIISWNVNGLKALVTGKKETLLSLVEKHQPDIMCFQVVLTD